MTKKLSNRIVLMLFCFFLIPFAGEAQGYLHRDNKKIVDGSGNEILLKGMGIGDYMIQEPYMMETGNFAGTQHELKAKIAALIGDSLTTQFYNAWLSDFFTKKDVDSLKKWGFNSIRLPMHYDLFTLPIQKEPVPGQNTWLPQGFQIVDSILSWCTKDKMYLILDLHAAPGGQGSNASISDYDSSKPSLWEDTNNVSKTVALWKKLAQRYADSTFIGGYDLLNEPNWDLSNGTILKQFYQKVIAAVRSVDKNHILFVEGNWYANDFTGLLPDSNGDTLFDSNMAYSFHKYWNATDVSTIQWMLDIRNTYNVPIWMGESGENSNEWFYETIKMVQANDVGWSWWPLKKLGSVTGPLTIKEPADYGTLLNYWQNGGTKPTVQFAYNALLQVAQNSKIENCTFHPDVIDAMFRQVTSDSIVSFAKLNIPGTISFTDYDMGKLNKAYWDKDFLDDGVTTTWNSGGAYRNDGVDVATTTDSVYSNGYYVGWINKGEWSKYTVNVQQTGVYNVIFRLSSGSSGGLFHIEANGQDVTGTIAVPSTGGWQMFENDTVRSIALKAGTDTLTFMADHDGFNISSMTWSGPNAVSAIAGRILSAVSNDKGTQIYLHFNKKLESGLILSSADFKLSNGNSVTLDSIVESKTDTALITLYTSSQLFSSDTLVLSYDPHSVVFNGQDTLASFTDFPVINNIIPSSIIPGKIEAENYTTDSGLSTEACSDTGGGQDMGYTDTGDYLEYLVYVSADGTYTVGVRVASIDNSAQARLSLMDNGTEQVLCTISIPNTGDWQKWTTVNEDITLTKGMHTLRYTVVNPRFNTNYFTFTQKATAVNHAAESDGSLTLYPNPSHGMVYVQSNELTAGSQIEVYNTNGQVLIDKQLSSAANSLNSVDLSNLPRGLYFVKISTKQNVITRKLLLK